jgi:hypothetical protein
MQVSLEQWAKALDVEVNELYKEIN